LAEWQLCLSDGKPEDAENVWTVLKGKPLQMVAHVISIESPKQLKLCRYQDDIDAKRADIRSDHDGGDSREVNAERGYGLPVRRNAGLLRAEAVFDDDERRSLAGEGGAEGGKAGSPQEPRAH